MTASVAHHDADTTVRQLLVGASVTGLRFGALQLLCASPGEPGEVFITLSSAFHVFASRPDALPAEEADVPELPEDAEILSLVALRFERIANAHIVEPPGHLVVTFAGGQVLYVCGSGPGPEPWHVGLNATDRSRSIQVIAISGSRPVVFRPHASER
jgi:hypothetical protein